MFCSRCGSEITGKSKFCPSCGLDLMATTPVHAIATGALHETDLVREALAAEYDIVEELGRGGMAMVYRARDRQLEREVAIKVLPFSLAFDAEFVERFQREARTAAQLEHPNIISIYRVGRAGRVIYFVMKFLRGGSLSTVLGERKKKLTPPEIRRLLLEAGSALGYAAQRGIVHRDIKPDNIMFDEFGQCVLTDFGIAKAASGQKLTGTGMSIGTPHYMSPEQARAQSIDGRSDIYSLGVVAYQCLTGTVPYDGEDSFSIGYKHITEPIPTPSLITADERRIFEVIKRMLMKDPADRFQSCEELVASIQGQPTAAPGAMRASAVAAGVGSGGRPSASASPIAGGPPIIVSQPTTPLESPLVNRRVTPLERRDLPRRVADRSLAMRGGSSGWTWLWVVLAILGGGGGGLYYYKAHGFAAGQGVAADSAALAPADTGARRDTTAASTPAPRPDPAPSPVAPSSSAPAPVVRTPPRPPDAPANLGDSTPSGGTGPVDSGGIRIVGLPRGSTVMIDERPVSEPVTRLAPGPHAVGVSAPRFNFYSDTFVVRPGEIQEITPPLSPIGSPELPRRRAPILQRLAGRCTPGPGYNSDASCFDERPKPVNPPFVPLPDEVTDTPRPSLLWVKVSVEGRTVDVKSIRPSNDTTFERAVRNFVWTVSWHPALKEGAPVEAWTQMLFPPAPQ
ncbi:MAG TPA: protein kinase [Gemmatimonadales bacterium]|nr:protein kinase [Gemmatimonadales bacterium]